MDPAPLASETEYWQSQDIHDHDDRQRRPEGWLLKVDTMTMDVLVCVQHLPCPFTGHPDRLPGQILINGQRWVSECVAALVLLLENRLLELVTLEEDAADARLQAMEWLRRKDREVAQLEESARQSNAQAKKNLEETRKRLRLLAPRKTLLH